MEVARHRLALLVDEPAAHAGRATHADRDRFGESPRMVVSAEQPAVGAECRQLAFTLRVEPEDLGLVAIEKDLMIRRRRQAEDDRPAHRSALGIDEADAAGRRGRDRDLGLVRSVVRGRRR